MPSTAVSLNQRYPINQHCHSIIEASGRYWIFYWDGTNIAFVSSTDGTTWSSPTTIRAVADAQSFEVVYDGARAHYVAVSTWIYYRRYTLNSDGTISPSADEQVVQATGSSKYTPTIDVDTGGHAWVSWNDGGNQAKCSKNANTDGTWANASGFPYQPFGGANAGNLPIVRCLGNGDGYIVYPRTGDTIVRGKYYTTATSTWSGEETVFNSNHNGAFGSMIGFGSDVHYADIEVTTNNMRHAVRTGGAWSAKKTIEAAGNSMPGLSRDSVSIVYCFYAKTDGHVYYRKYVSGTWDAAATDWFNETTIQDSTKIAVGRDGTTGRIIVAWVKASANPWLVRFDTLAVAISTTGFRVEGRDFKETKF